jgi:hypothetical protein
MLGSGFKHEAARMRVERQQLMDEPHDWVLRELVSTVSSYHSRCLSGLLPERAS